MKVNLSDQVAIVTGGAAGIGQAIASVLAENDAQVVIVDIDAERARNTAKEISDQGLLRGDSADVADPAQMAQVAEQVVDRFGRIDILINNAGINTRRDRVPVHEYKLEDWNKILQVDLTGVFIASRAIIPAMLRNQTRPHCQHKLYCWTGAVAAAECVCRCQSWSGESHSLHGTGAGAPGDSGECGRPGLHFDCRHGSLVLRT